MPRLMSPMSLKVFNPAAPTAYCHSVSAGGGLARQYRVQSRFPQGDAWHVERIFARIEDAEAFLQARPSDGRDVRLVRFGVSPAAA